MNVAQLATTRRTAKAFAPDRPLPADLLEQIRVLLRYSPSSVLWFQIGDRNWSIR